MLATDGCFVAISTSSCKDDLLGIRILKVQGTDASFLDLHCPSLDHSVAAKLKAMVTIRVSSDLVSHRKPDLRLLCLHGHGGTPARLCGNLEVFFQSVLNGSPGDPCDGEAEAFAVECRCVAAPLPEASRREGGRQWWRYDEDGYGDRPDDWAEMELATTKLAEELLTAQQADRPFDGILGFSQGAEMVHTVALLKHQDDPRFQSLTPRFVVSLSGAINPAHFESVSGGGPPLDCPGPYFGPKPNELLGLSSFVKKACFDNQSVFQVYFRVPWLCDVPLWTSGICVHFNTFLSQNVCHCNKLVFHKQLVFHSRVKLPCLFVGDFVSDGWYSSQRFCRTKDLYADQTVVMHSQKHKVPSLCEVQDIQSICKVRRFFSRFVRQR